MTTQTNGELLWLFCQVFCSFVTSVRKTSNGQKKKYNLKKHQNQTKTKYPKTK